MARLKVLLIDPPEFSQTGQTEKHQPNMGLAYINAVLTEMGFDSIILDTFGHEYDKIDKKISEFAPQVLCISARTFNINGAAEIARRVKENGKDILTVIGGSHITALPERTLKEFRDFDLGVIGEGEETIKELLSNFKMIRDTKFLKKVKGIAYRKGSDIVINEQRGVIKDIDSLPFPNWNGIDFSNYKKEFSWRLKGKYFQFPILFSRGCPFNCTFCANYNRIWRHRNPRKVVDEIEYFIRKYGANVFEIVDSTSTINRESFIEFCDEIIRRSLQNKISWYCETRVDQVNSKLMRKIKEAGCEYVFFGIESGDDDILKKMNKRITRDKVREAISITKKSGLKVGGSFIIGHPYEKKENIIKTINFAVELSRYGLDGANFFIIDVYPGTKVWDMVENCEGGARWVEGKRYNWDSYNRFEPQIEVGELDPEKLIRLRNYAQKRFNNATNIRKTKRILVSILYKSKYTKHFIRKIIVPPLNRIEKNIVHG